MGKQKKSFRSEVRERAKLILDADKLASLAADFGRGAVEKNLRAFWGAASLKHKQAAIGYRKAGLGLLAREQWLSRAAVCDVIGNAEEAATCRREAAAIPAYFEEASK
jgi:hypothetical protein